MKFYQALQLLKDGNKIRRTTWEDGHYWKLNNIKYLVNSVGVNPSINLAQLNATDWEIYKEESEVKEEIEKLFPKEMIGILKKFILKTIREN